MKKIFTNFVSVIKWIELSYSVILKKNKILLASGSPRRKQLLTDLQLDLEVIVKPTDESYPLDMNVYEVPLFIAQQKAAAFSLEDIKDNILIAADTVVIHAGAILGKPTDEKEAIEMLQRLAGSKHEVVTGVVLKSKEKEITLSALTEVYFCALSIQEIEFYVKNYKPYDKAGSYGAQEWMGMVAVEKINGSYFNVVGLPVQAVYQALKEHFC